MYKLLIIRLLLLGSVIFVLSGCVKAPGMPLFNTSSLEKKKQFNQGVDFKLIKLSFANVKYYAQPNTYFQKESKSSALRVKSYSKVYGQARGVGGYRYLIGSRDVLNIKVWGEPEVSTSGANVSFSPSVYVVNKEGYFFFPYAGKIRAKGRTEEQIRVNLAQKLAKYINDPQVGVSIASYKSQSASISGQVLAARTYEINSKPLTVRDAIAKAGGLKQMVIKSNGLSRTRSRRYGGGNFGLTYGVSSSGGTEKVELPKRALLTRANGQKIIVDLDELLSKGNESYNYLLRGGDALHVYIPEPVRQNSKENRYERLRKIFMMGELQRPGTIVMDSRGMTLAEALSDRGGIKETTADPSGVFIMRNVKNGIPIVFQLSLQSVHSMLLAEKFALHERDIVYVTAAPVSRWGRVLGQVLPFLSTASAVDRLVP